jgi:DNA-directed RNA polymerase specialized sigma24 family protein
VFSLALPVSSFDGWFERLRDDLTRHALTFTQSHDDALDTVQDLYLTARESLTSYSRGNNLPEVRAWLIGICNHLLQTRTRRYIASQQAISRLLDSLLTHRYRLTRGELYDAAIWRIRMADLTPQQAACVRLKLDGHSFRTIATYRRLSVATVVEHVNAAVARMQACDAGSLQGADLSEYAKKGQRITRYWAPTTVGSALSRERLKRLK